VTASQVEIYVPVPRRLEDTSAHSGSEPISVSGKAVAILDNRWFSMRRLSVVLERELRVSYGAGDVIHYEVSQGHKPTGAFHDEIAAKVAGAITGLGN
jgi:hypothetical protein